MDTNTVLAQAPPSDLRPKPHRCTYGVFGSSDPESIANGYGNEFKPSTHSYAKIAHAYEKYNNNNAAFNGRSLSDNKPITDFYTAKARGVDHVHKMRPYINDLESIKRNNL